MAGMVGTTIWTLFCLKHGMDGSWSSLVNVLACGIPMVLWSVFVDKVHRNPTTGIDWDGPPRSWGDAFDYSSTKLAGLWATWAIIAFCYCVFRFFWRGNYLFAMEFFSAGAIPLFLLSIPYVWWLDRRLKCPRDGAWHLGAFLMGIPDWNKAAVIRHFQAWAVKGFFIAFMISIVPGNWQNFIATDMNAVRTNPVALTNWLIALMFVLDVAFATVGYMLTMKPLDSHIRSATPYAAGWAAALICYPPFVIMGDGGPLDYHIATKDWFLWMEGHQTVQAIYGALLVFLTGIYAWATIIFGLRFSNLTDRGVITNGPYAFTKHPAYLSKNTFWWLSTLPFLVTNNSTTDAIRNTVLMAAVSLVYFWRAKTEERHLNNDPAYGRYADWMADYGLITRWLTPRNWFSRHDKAGTALATPAE